MNEIECLKKIEKGWAKLAQDGTKYKHNISELADNLNDCPACQYVYDNFPEARGKCGQINALKCRVFCPMQEAWGVTHCENDGSPYRNWDNAIIPEHKEVIAFKISKWAKKIRENKNADIITETGYYEAESDLFTFPVEIVSLNKHLAIGWLSIKSNCSPSWAGIWGCRNGECCSLWYVSGNKVTDNLSKYNIIRGK